MAETYNYVHHNPYVKWAIKVMANIKPLPFDNTPEKRINIQTIDSFLPSKCLTEKTLRLDPIIDILFLIKDNTLHAICFDST